jgi:hypothetical protein
MSKLKNMKCGAGISKGRSGSLLRHWREVRRAQFICDCICPRTGVRTVLLVKVDDRQKRAALAVVLTLQDPVHRRLRSAQFAGDFLLAPACRVFDFP